MERDSLDAASVFLAGGGELGRLLRGLDWSKTPLGCPGRWPQALRVALRLVLDSPAPLALGWGPDRILLYNDAAVPLLGDRHPSALGQPMAAVDLPEGVSVLYLSDEQGLARRRFETLREVVRQIPESTTLEELCAGVVPALARNPHDLPFSLLYLLDAEGQQLRRMDREQDPPLVDLERSVREVLATGHARRIEPGPLPQPALLIPLARGTDRPLGVLVAGLHPRSPLDMDRRAFLDDLVSLLSAAVEQIGVRELEIERVELMADLEHARTLFLSHVSHELRTSLSLVLGPIEELLAQAHEPGPRGRLELLRRHGMRLQKLVDNVLDFSLLELGRLQLTHQPTDLAGLTDELASAFRPAAQRAGLRLRALCPPLPEPVWVDRDMWEKIVLNLLSNALKFTFEGEIEVALAPADRGVQLTVRDTGIGIESEHLTRIFERFYRAPARGRTLEGTGIGLALVRELVQLHGGTIRAESQPGAGTTFLVWIPSVPRTQGTTDTTRPQRSAPRARAFVDEASSWLLRPPATIEEPAALGSRILIADDHADTCAYLAQLLSPLGYVETVSDGVAALERVRGQPPDLLLADVLLPEMDGLELLRTLRAEPSTRRLPVMLLSARGGEEARREAVEADEYVSKPFSPRELYARARSLLLLARERRECDSRFASLADSVPMPLWTTDAEGHLTYVNEAYRDLFGATWQPMTSPEVREALQRREPVRLQARVRRADGRWRCLESHIRPRFGVTGEFLGLTGSSQDIPQRRGRERGKQSRAALERLVANLLDTTPLSRGKVRPPRQPLELGELVARLVEEHRPLFERAGGRLEQDPVLEALWVEADRDRLVQVLAHLLQDAARSTGVDGVTRVELARDESGRQVLLRVVDAGEPGRGSAFDVRLPLATPPYSDLSEESSRV
jgi:PAS domain S-box-containing protein